jgi:hypothetical protein
MDDRPAATAPFLDFTLVPPFACPVDGGVVDADHPADVVVEDFPGGLRAEPLGELGAEEAVAAMLVKFGCRVEFAPGLDGVVAVPRVVFCRADGELDHFLSDGTLDRGRFVPLHLLGGALLVTVQHSSDYDRWHRDRDLPQCSMNQGTCIHRSGGEQARTKSKQ